MPDSGLILSDVDWAWGSNGSETHTFRTWVRRMVRDVWGAEGLNAACVAAQRRAGGDVSDCWWAEATLRHTRTPVFALQSLRDPTLEKVHQKQSKGGTQKRGQPHMQTGDLSVDQHRPEWGALVWDVGFHLWEPPCLNALQRLGIVVRK